MACSSPKMSLWIHFCFQHLLDHCYSRFIYPIDSPVQACNCDSTPDTCTELILIIFTMIQQKRARSEIHGIKFLIIGLPSQIIWKKLIKIRVNLNGLNGALFIKKVIYLQTLKLQLIIIVYCFPIFIIKIYISVFWHPLFERISCSNSMQQISN